MSEDLTNNVRPLRPEDLISEKDALEKWPQFLGRNTLKDMRQAGEIGFTTAKRTIFYSRAEVEQFIVSGWHRETAGNDDQADEPEDNPWHEKSSASENIGSTKSTEAGTGTGSGMTPELEAIASARCAQQTSKKQK